MLIFWLLERSIFIAEKRETYLWILQILSYNLDALKIHTIISRFYREWSEKAKYPVSVSTVEKMPCVPEVRGDWF